MLCHRSTLDTLTSSYCHVTLCHWPPGRSSTFSRPHPPVTWGAGPGPGPGPSDPSLSSPCCGKVERVIVSSSVIRCHSSAVEAGGGSLATRGECPIRQLSHKAEAAEREWERRGENERGRPGKKIIPSCLWRGQAAAGANYSDMLTISTLEQRERGTRLSNPCFVSLWNSSRGVYVYNRRHNRMRNLTWIIASQLLIVLSWRHILVYLLYLWVCVPLC